MLLIPAGFDAEEGVRAPRARERDYRPCSRITRARAEPSRRVRLGMNFA